MNRCAPHFRNDCLYLVPCRSAKLRWKAFRRRCTANAMAASTGQCTPHFSFTISPTSAMITAGQTVTVGFAETRLRAAGSRGKTVHGRIAVDSIWRGIPRSTPWLMRRPHSPPRRATTSLEELSFSRDVATSELALAGANPVFSCLTCWITTACLAGAED